MKYINDLFSIRKKFWHPLKNRTFVYFYQFTLSFFFIVTVMGKQVIISKYMIENVKSISSKPKNLKNSSIFFFATEIYPKKLER